MGDIKTVKEEVVKSFVKSSIDKLIFGLVATLIVYCVQERMDSNKRAQIAIEAILKLESEDIQEATQQIRRHFLSYMQDVSKIKIDGFEPTDDQIESLRKSKNDIKSDIELLSIYDTELKSESSELIRAIEFLNEQIATTQSSEVFERAFDKVKISYKDYLQKLRMASIRSIVGINNT